MAKHATITKAGLQHKADWGNSHLVRMSRDDMHEIVVRRNDWVMLTNLETGDRIYRMVRGATEEDFERGSIRVDYDGANEFDRPWVRAYYEKLGPKYYEADPSETLTEANWAVSKCSFFQKIAAYWSYPDQGYRFSLQIAVISFVLGAVGLIVGLIDLIHNWV